MGKLSVNNSRPSDEVDVSKTSTPTPITPVKNTNQVNSNILPGLSKKEWITVLSAVFIVLSIGFCLGFVVNYKRLNDASHILSIVDPLITMEKDLNDKLRVASKQMDKIDDDDFSSDLSQSYLALRMYLTTKAGVKYTKEDFAALATQNVYVSEHQMERTTHIKYTHPHNIILPKCLNNANTIIKQKHSKRISYLHAKSYAIFQKSKAQRRNFKHSLLEDRNKSN